LGLNKKRAAEVCSPLIISFWFTYHILHSFHNILISLLWWWWWWIAVCK